MMRSHLLIGAASSGSGKTTFTMGLLRALKKRGLQIQPFKCGPDYIDSLYHKIAADNKTVNLDTWMGSETHVKHLYNKYGENSDVCITEGVMGLFDGYNRMQGSSFEIAKLLDIPIILMVSAQSTAYSVAPLIYGFKHFNPSVRIAGVVFNKVASPSHFSYLKDACTDVGVDCLGYLPIASNLKIPSRHLGLTLSTEHSMNALIEQASLLVEEYVDIDKLLEVCRYDFSHHYNNPEVGDIVSRPGNLRIAVANDAAFNFTYRENIARLSELGNITYFSPLNGDDLPDTDLLYLPGGYPELFAYQLHKQKKLLKAIKSYAEEGGKILAECGGMMLLTRSLTVSQEEPAYEMADVLPLDCTMTGAKLHLGYRRLIYNGMKLHGHEFHYSNVITPNTLSSVAKQYNVKGEEVDTPLYKYKNVIAGYTHLYWGETDILKLWEA